MPQDWEEFHLQPRQMAGMISHLWVFFLTKTILIWLSIQGMNLNKSLEVLMRIKTQLSHMRCDWATVTRRSLSRLPLNTCAPLFSFRLLALPISPSHTQPYCTLSGWQVQVSCTSKPRSLPQAIQSSPAESIHSWKIRTCLRLSRLKEHKLKVQTSGIYSAQQLWIYSMGLNACYKNQWELTQLLLTESGLLLLSRLTGRYSCVCRLRKTECLTLLSSLWLILKSTVLT